MGRVGGAIKGTGDHGGKGEGYDNRQAAPAGNATQSGCRLLPPYNLVESLGEMPIKEVDFGRPNHSESNL